MSINKDVKTKTTQETDTLLDRNTIFSIFSPMKILVHDRGVCLECAGCVGVCPKMALDMYGLDLQIAQEKCVRCGLCTKACPAGALKLQEMNDVL